MRARDSSLGGGSLLNLAGAAFATVVNIGLVITITQGVSTRTAGILFAGTSAFLLAEKLGRLGTSTGLVYFIAQARARGAPSLSRELLRVAAQPVMVVVVIICATAQLFAPQLAALILPDDTGVATPMLRILALFLPAAVLMEVLLAATRGFRQMRPTVLSERIAVPLLQLLATVAVVTAGGGPAALAFAWASAYVPGLAIAVVAWRRTLSQLSAAPQPPTPSSVTAGTFWVFTTPRAVSSLVQLALARLDILLVAALQGPSVAALYTAATRCVVVGQLVNQAIATSLEPQLAELTAQGNFAEAGRIYRLATVWLVLLTWPFYLLTAVFAPELLMVFGPEYSEAALVVIVLAGAMLLATASGMVEVVLVMAGRSSWTVWSAVTALAVMVGLDLLLIPSLGAVGAAVAWASAILVRNALGLVLLWAGYRLHPFGSALARATGLSAATLGAFPLLGFAATSGSLLGRVIGAAAGLVVFLIVALRWRETLGISDLLRQVNGLRRRPQQPSPPVPAAAAGRPS